MYLINSLNPRINRKIGEAYFDTEIQKFLFKLIWDQEEEFLGYYVIKPRNLSKVTDYEKELLAVGGKTKIKRPKGYGY